jgi:aspartate/methionine/tyrosine aminotransferase
MFDAAQKLEKQGRKIIHLEIGRPDFNTPEHIVEAAIDALRAGKHHYSQNAGIPELRQAISDKFSSEYNLGYDPQTEVVVSNGVAEGVYVAIHALLNPGDEILILLNPGDEILIPDPRWVNYDVDAFTNSVDPVDYTLLEDSGFQPDPEEIKEKITGRTKM